MKFNFLITLFILPFTGISQNQGTTHIGFNFSTNYSYRKIKTEPDTEWIWELREESEEAIIGFNSGVTAFHKFANKLSIESGIQYTRFGEKVVDTDLLTPDGTTSTDNKFVSNYDYIGVPVKIGYRFALGNRVDLVVQGGVASNIYFARQFKSKIVWNDGESTTNKSTYFDVEYGVNRLNFVGLISAGVDFKMSDSFILRTEPTFQYAITSMVDAPIKQWPYAAGINVGLYYQLGSK